MNIPNVKSNSVRAIGATPVISICAGWMSPPPDDIDETTCVAHHCTTSAKSDITTTVGTAKVSQVPRSHLVRVMPWVQARRLVLRSNSDATIGVPKTSPMKSGSSAIAVWTYEALLSPQQLRRNESPG